MTASTGKTDFRERLLASETIDSALRAEYERKLSTMFETQLSAKKRIWFTILILFSVTAGAVAIMLAVTEKLPPAPRIGLLIGAAFSAAWVFYLVRMLRRGVMRRRIDPPVAAGMAFGFSLLMCIVLAVGGAPSDKVLLMAVLFLIPAGLMLLRTVIEQSEMRMQERLVELQYNIARLAERLGDDDSDQAGAGVRR